MITKIVIQGYKSIKAQDVHLAPINIIIGGNGVGKSNLISVFSLIRNLYERTLQDYVIKKGGADSF
ncbi:AAA family ATPase [Pedobacter sp. CG_S7]|uniref:AAA family ATPase n=1 Tax=Pedobacter sp. CG_S7 TaxID=3143930 RepID=UPI00339692EA